MAVDSNSGPRRVSATAEAPQAPVFERSATLGRRTSFAQYARDWIETYTGRTGRGITESTREDYRRSLELHAIPRLGSVAVGDVRPQDIRGLVADLERVGQAPSSVRKNLAPVKTMFATAVEDGVVPTNPTAVVRIAGLRDGWESSEPRVLTRAELTALLAELPPDWRPFFELLLHTGVRISDAIGLVWGDVELGEQPHLRIRRQVCRGRVKPPKSRYGRRDIPLAPRMANTLGQLRASSSFAADEDPAFASRAGGHLEVSNIRSRVLRPSAERAGLGTVGFHAFRHSCASLLFAAGKDLKQVQEWLGHHDAAFTLSTYVHLLDRGLGDASFLDDVVADSTHRDSVRTPNANSGVL